VHGIFVFEGIALIGFKGPTYGKKLMSTTLLVNTPDAQQSHIHSDASRANVPTFSNKELWRESAGT
jgi:hypothetical protein